MPVRPISATADAKAVATAASTTLPPSARISAPTTAAIGCCADTTPRSAWAGGSPAKAVRVRSAERIEQRSSLETSDGQRGVQTFRAHARALTDAMAAPHTVATKDLV